MKVIHGIWAAALCAAATSAAAQPAAGYADLILTNAKVVTVDPNETIAQAVAVNGNRISAVGSAAEIAAWRGPGTKVLDMKGKTVLPGFIDGHSHVAGMALVEAQFINIQAPPLKDANAIIAVLKAKAATLPKGAWLIGQGTYNQLMPTREQLDAAFPDNPVELMWSNHDHLINHKAAMELGLGKDAPDPGGRGIFERTKDGEVAIARDADVKWVRKPQTYEEMKSAVRMILDDFYLKKGVTTVYDMSEPPTFRAYQDLYQEGKLPTRVLMEPRPSVPGREIPMQLSDILSTGVRQGFGDDYLAMGALKTMTDGVWGTTAYVWKPFWNGSGTTWMPNNTGKTNWPSQEEFNTFIKSAHDAGWQIQVHANGDRGQDMVLDAYEAAQRANPRADARHRIEHFGHFLTQDPERTRQRLARMVQDKVIASLQVAFLWRLTDTNVLEPDVKFFPIRTLLNEGIRLSGGVDTIGTQNYATPPIFSISRAVRRDTKYGKVVQPQEAATVMEGIKLFTIWPAYAGFIEKTRGSVEVGKLADLIVMSEDPLTVGAKRLPDIQVDMTILDGKLVYERKAGK
ncbi:amidohydrolase [Phenylobacterium sp.]|jgi:predicted amidohydrolase YtcJ|uniref:amidohydrolase n=1 Tax=Phenylobacterium sp. TaxID=1871053 RepID=UPI003784D4C1